MVDNITIEKITNNADGTVSVDFDINGSKVGKQYSSRAHLERACNKVWEREDLIFFVLAYWCGRNPTLSNEAVIIGKTLTVDFSQPSPIR